MTNQTPFKIVIQGSYAELSFDSDAWISVEHACNCLRIIEDSYVSICESYDGYLVTDDLVFQMNAKLYDVFQNLVQTGQVEHNNKVWFCYESKN